MQRLRILGLALMAMFMLSAVASTAASAVALPDFSVETGAKGTSDKGQLGPFQCKSSSILMTPENKLQGLFHIHFENCTGPLNEKCESLGDKPGIILVLGKYHLVRAASEHVFLWLLLEEVHIECLGIIEVLVSVRGSALVLILPILTKTNKYELDVKQSKGDQEFLKYENDEGKLVNAEPFLEAKIGGGAFELAGDESENNKLTAAKETLIENTK